MSSLSAVVAIVPMATMAKLARALVILLVLPSLLVGCWFIAGAALGGAGVVYVKGEASKLYSRSVSDVYFAALRVLEDSEVIITEKLRGDDVSTIRGRTAGGKELTMRIEQAGHNVAKVKLRIGLIGDRDYSTLILSRLDRALGQ